jgi:hypothetical protein
MTSKVFTLIPRFEEEKTLGIMRKITKGLTIPPVK